MYSIIQFLESDGGTISVVNSEWLTPRKCEVFWPPVKGSKAFDRALTNSVFSPDDKWKLYGVQRIFCETDCILKAKQKLKLVETTSDLQTEEEDSIVRPEKRKATKTNRFISSDDDDEDDYRSPPPLKKHFVNLLQDTNPSELSFQIRPSTSTPQSHIEEIRPSTSTPQSNIKKIRPSTSMPQDARESNSKLTQDSFPTLSSSILQNLEENLLSTENPRQIYLQKTNLELTGFQEKVVTLLTLIKIQNDQMLSILKQKHGSLILKPIYKFPLQTNEQLETTEDLLNDKDNYDNLVSYLETLGGRDTSNRATRILKTIFSDALAKDFNFYGKRSSKRPFCQLRIRDCLVEAVKNTTGASEKHIEDNIKVWLKHAPERLMKKEKNVVK